MTDSFVGVKGCGPGWLAVVLRANEWTVQLYPSVFSLWYNHREANRILVDIPIGLPESKDEDPRACDTVARERLTPHSHRSVFPAPSRQATREDTYEAAKKVNHRIIGKNLNSFTWGRLPKIRELDELLHFDPGATNQIRETHPEICYWALNGYEPIPYGKMTAPGRKERKGILETAFPEFSEIFEHMSSRFNTHNIREHDIIDVLAIAITANTSERHLRTLPGNPEHDARGLPMEIVYATEWVTNQSRMNDYITENDD